jgi:hypothetical protein
VSRQTDLATFLIRKYSQPEVQKALREKIIQDDLRRLERSQKREAKRNEGKQTKGKEGKPPKEGKLTKRFKLR